MTSVHAPAQHKEPRTMSNRPVNTAGPHSGERRNCFAVCKEGGATAVDKWRHLADFRYFALAKCVSANVHDHVDRRSNVFVDGVSRPLSAVLHHQCFQPAKHIGGGVGVARGHGTVVAGIHGGEHVDHFATAHFANHEPIWAKPQCSA